jgi:hypothetical protein
MEHPLPYRWRISSDNEWKRKIKLYNSLKILGEIKKRFTNFEAGDK